MKECIVRKLKEKGFDKYEGYGKILNFLQDVAYDNLTKNSIRQYENKMGRDMEECDGMDGIFINGQYFDWKEYEWNKWAHVSAWLGYFNEQDQEKIYNAI